MTERRPNQPIRESEFIGNISLAVIISRDNDLRSQLENGEDVEVIGDQEAFIIYIENGQAEEDWHMLVNHNKAELDDLFPPLSRNPSPTNNPE